MSRLSLLSRFVIAVVALVAGMTLGWRVGYADTKTRQAPPISILRSNQIDEICSVNTGNLSNLLRYGVFNATGLCDAAINGQLETLSTTCASGKWSLFVKIYDCNGNVMESGTQFSVSYLVDGSSSPCTLNFTYYPAADGWSPVTSCLTGNLPFDVTVTRITLGASMQTVAVRVWCCTCD